MSKTALFFPGQASQYVGMGKDLYDSSPEVRGLYDIAEVEMGVDIAKISFEGPADELKRTAYTQPAILLHSLAILAVLHDNVPEFDFAAGHSLGEYGALAVAGALSYEEAVKAVVKRAALMEEACQNNPGTMAAIIGLDFDRVSEVCERADGIVVPANYNSGSQLVISGAVAAVEQAVELAKEAGAKRAIMLEVGGAFHSPLMESARDGMEAYLKEIEIHPISKPVIANVTARPAGEPDDIREALVQQIVAPVKWAQTMTYLKENGVDSIIEIGPGTVLSGLAKREMRPAKSLNLDTLADVTAFASAETK
ncbi:MAG: ACP S-malonyltransferase [Candidatus Zixiibacteriota bacterium]|jgi:[acyl-carrier-protein] S-malonyltransferase